MRAGLVVGLVLLLTAPARADRRSTAAELELGTGTLDRGEVAVGPLALGIGVWHRLTVGTYVAPWAVVAHDDYSVIPNGFAKLGPLRLGRYSLALGSALFFVHLEDLDGDGINARGFVWPSQLIASADWSKRWATTVELTGVAVGATASQRRDQDTEIHGVALANTFHVGVVQRFQWTRNFALWARGRAVLAHAPLVVNAQAELSESARLRVQAQARSARISSALAGMVGFVWTRGHFNLRLGAGYGHWVLPWVLLPVGENIPCGEISLYWRL